METTQSPPNRLGLLGWLGGGRRGAEAYVYLLHRVCGVILLLYLSVHIFITSARLFGAEAWSKQCKMTHLFGYHYFEFLVFAAFAFHAFNGIRLLFIEFGLGLGRPERPVYPYRGSVRRQRPLMLVMMVLTAVLIAAGGFELLRFPH